MCFSVAAANSKKDGQFSFCQTSPERSKTEMTWQSVVTKWTFERLRKRLLNDSVHRQLIVVIQAIQVIQPSGRVQGARLSIDEDIWVPLPQDFEDQITIPFHAQTDGHTDTRTHGHTEHKHTHRDTHKDTQRYSCLLLHVDTLVSTYDFKHICAYTYSYWYTDTCIHAHKLWKHWPYTAAQGFGLLVSLG